MGQSLILARKQKYLLTYNFHKYLHFVCVQTELYKRLVLSCSITVTEWPCLMLVFSELILQLKKRIPILSCDCQASWQEHQSLVGIIRAAPKRWGQYCSFSVFIYDDNWLLLTINMYMMVFLIYSVLYHYVYWHRCTAK